jgi:REP element-mobilizing transposase RayT
MYTINKDSPCVFLTSVTHNRIPIFVTDKLKQIACDAFDEARRSGEIDILSYVIMPDHYHMVVRSEKRKPSDIARYMNGISARRIIDYLKECGFTTSLEKLRTLTKKREYKHSVWQHNPDSMLITSESMLMQKVNYIHHNPVRAGFVERPQDYLFSSARIWMERPIENEPLSVDNGKIRWREAQPRA